MRTRAVLVHAPLVAAGRVVADYALRQKAGELRMRRKVFVSKVFDRKVVVITGGCAGIGRALAVRMGRLRKAVEEPMRLSWRRSSCSSTSAAATLV